MITVFLFFDDYHLKIVGICATTPCRWHRSVSVVIIVNLEQYINAGDVDIRVAYFYKVVIVRHKGQRSGLLYETIHDSLGP